MKKKKPETIQWSELKVGDCIEDARSRLFCFAVEKGIASCMGKNKPMVWKYNIQPEISKYKRIKPTKSFIKLCKHLLDLNLKEHHLDNLSYAEALAALKKYE